MTETLHPHTWEDDIVDQVEAIDDELVRVYSQMDPLVTRWEEAFRQSTAVWKVVLDEDHPDWLPAWARVRQAREPITGVIEQCHARLSKRKAVLQRPCTGAGRCKTRGSS